MKAEEAQIEDENNKYIIVRRLFACHVSIIYYNAGGNSQGGGRK